MLGIEGFNVKELIVENTLFFTVIKLTAWTIAIVTGILFAVNKFIYISKIKFRVESEDQGNPIPVKNQGNIHFGVIDYSGKRVLLKKVFLEYDPTKVKMHQTTGVEVDMGDTSKNRISLRYDHDKKMSQDVIVGNFFSYNAREDFSVKLTAYAEVEIESLPPRW